MPEVHALGPLTDIPTDGAHIPNLRRTNLSGRVHQDIKLFLYHVRYF